MVGESVTDPQFGEIVDLRRELTAAQQRIAELEDIGRRVLVTADNWLPKGKVWKPIEALRAALRAGQGGGGG